MKWAANFGEPEVNCANAEAGYADISRGKILLKQFADNNGLFQFETS